MFLPIHTSVYEISKTLANKESFAILIFMSGVLVSISHVCVVNFLAWDLVRKIKSEKHFMKIPFYVVLWRKISQLKVIGRHCLRGSLIVYKFSYTSL